MTRNIDHTGLTVREPLFSYEQDVTVSHKNFGTFSDSKRAPIHRWFQYPAGFSYKAVEHVLSLHHIGSSDLVYDPFTGTGTTNVVCKSKGITSIGIEAHPFVFKVAKVKNYWDYTNTQLRDTITETIENIKQKSSIDIMDNNSVPELVRKCYSAKNLSKLLMIREVIEEIKDIKIKELLALALTGALRRASAAATGWPYIAPKKKIQERDGIQCFIEQLYEMYDDLTRIPDEIRKNPAYILLADARHSPLSANSVDLSFTSPPYLNNYDYADRTRLETYFNGLVSSWGEITEKIRKKLIVSATTQINRFEYNLSNIISDLIWNADPVIARELTQKIHLLSKIRISKGGKKSYDIMVGQYFNDMTEVLIDNYRALKQGSCFALILGDSAPYGVYIPTEEILGKIGLGVGYSNYSIFKLRDRGLKWKSNPQRHHVPLKESILTLKK